MSDLQVEYIQELQERIATLEADLTAQSETTWAWKLRAEKAKADLQRVREAAEPFVKAFEKWNANGIREWAAYGDYVRGEWAEDLAQAIESTGAPERREEKK